MLQVLSNSELSEIQNKESTINEAIRETNPFFFMFG